MSTWIQFGVLLFAIAAAALRTESRMTQIEVKIEPMWQWFLHKVEPHNGGSAKGERIP